MMNCMRDLNSVNYNFKVFRKTYGCKKKRNIYPLNSGSEIPIKKIFPSIIYLTCDLGERQDSFDDDDL